MEGGGGGGGSKWSLFQEEWVDFPGGEGPQLRADRAGPGSGSESAQTDSDLRAGLP